MADYSIHDTTLTGISNVIRKKDGTSALIDPADYADRINLMGMLEEKTVSSSPIVTFPDGADAVPLKKCEITLPASLDGYTSVDAVSTGKNLADGNMTQDGANRVVLINNIYLVSSTYTISLVIASPRNFYFRKHNGGSWTNLGGYNKSVVTFSISENDYYDFSYYVSTGVLLDEISNLQLEVGSSATTYEPYTAPTTHTADLGRTIHGGTADVVKGQGESKCGKIVFDGSADENWTAYAGGNGYLIAVADMERGTWYTSEFADSSPLPKVPDNNSFGVRIGVNNNGVYVVQANTISGVTDLASFKAYLAENPLTVIYPLATPETFTFDPVPIDSKLGNNTIWSEQGNTEVTYRGQGTVTVYPNAEEASF